MTTITFPSTTHLQRLRHLPLAVDEAPGPLSHISFTIRGDRLRFMATNGRMLAAMILDITNPTGADLDLLLDADQFAKACQAIAKARPAASIVTLTVDQERREVRMGSPAASALIRLGDGVFPNVDHAWTRTAGRSWVPTVSSLDQQLVGIAAKIIGIARPLFMSTVAARSVLPGLIWGTAPATNLHEDARQDLRALVGAPAFWADDNLAILIMPISRPVPEQPLDLQPFILPHMVNARAA